MGATLERGLDLDWSKTHRPQDPRDAATSGLGDGTFYRSHHAARWSYQDASVISGRPRTTPRTTATPGASLSSAAQCTFYSSWPLHAPDLRRNNDFSPFPYMYTAPP